jgi:hypothetical protein
MFEWLIPVFIWFSSPGNMDYSPDDRNVYNKQLAIHGSFEANSNALNADMIRFFIGGRYINENMKDRSLKRMAPNNRMGLDGGLEVSYFHKPDSGFGKNWSYGITVGQKILFGGEFSKDAYKLGFYGNAPYAGTTLDFSGLKSRFLNYQFITLGFVKEFEGQKWHKALGFGVSAINANQFFELNVPRGDLFTEINGKELILDGAYELSQNDASKNKFFYPNGFGASGTLEFRATDRKRHMITVRASNFGFIRFNKFSSSRNLDTSLSFKGLQINNVFDLNGNFINNAVDSLSARLAGTEKGGVRFMAMPADFEVSYTYIAIPQKLFVGATVDYKYYPGYFPKFAARITGIPDPMVSISGIFSYGGWGGFNGGVDLGFHFTKGWHFVVGSHTLQGIISERNTSGLSLNAGLSKRFGKSKRNK